MPLFTLRNVDSFEAVRAVQPRSIVQAAISTVQSLDEKNEIEAWLQAILFDTNRTPHGPAEIVDILTHKLVVRGREGLSAFILKGRSFPTVRPAHVSHQIFHLERLAGLNYAIFAASGTILDEVKAQFLSTTRRLRIDYCFLDAHDLARLFVAYGFLCPRDGEKLRGGRCRCGYTPPNRTSNLLQQEALRELASTHTMRQPTGAVILPTGSGKTRIAVLDAHRTTPTTCIYVAHSHEILDIAEEEFRKEFPADDIRRFEAPPRVDTIGRVNLITIQLLARNLDAFAGRAVDYMIIDEFHHAAAASYRRALDVLHPGFLLGLTATPFRGDRQDVLELCRNNVVICYELRQGIEFGVLCPYHYYGCFDDIDYSQIRHNGQRYDIRDLERALVIPERDDAIIDKWREKANDKPTLAFCCSHLHARRVCDNFVRQSIPSEVYLSTTARDARLAMLDNMKRGDTRVLCVVDVLNEGVDLPFVECLLFLRPTESKRVFFQQMGRGLRRFVGKEHCVIIDFIGNFHNSYRAVENLGLEPYEGDDSVLTSAGTQSAKDVLNLPTGCRVEFDEKVISIFGDQTLNPAFATRFNIARILVYQYRRLERRLGRRPSKPDVDRNCLLDSRLYIMVFGNWNDFQRSLDNN